MNKGDIVLGALVAATTMFMIGAIRAQIKIAYHQGRIDALDEQSKQLDEILKMFKEEEAQ